MARELLAHLQSLPKITWKLFFTAVIFATPKTVSLAQSCEDIYVPVECKAKKACDYDAIIDACIPSKQICSAGYVEGDKACQKKSCGTHDGRERFYMDRWKEIKSYPGTCTSGLFAEFICDEEGLVKKVGDGLMKPLSRDCARVTDPR